MSDNPFRDLPSVDSVVNQVETALPRAVVVVTVRGVIEEARAAMARGETFDVSTEAQAAVRRIERSGATSVLNASGVLLHTNLGRAPWSLEAAQRALGVATGYSNTELDLSTGSRGSRGVQVANLLSQLTGAEDALVVNNNAAALLLTLAATSSGLAVPVSRGELIEIGGSYRLPDVMTVSGAQLVEVGTTNRTKIGDYQTAAQVHGCGAILKVHPSNYRVEGFTEEASLEQLASLASERSLPLIFDVGSGLLDSDASWVPAWILSEPAVRQSLAAGADIVMFSGDKLLGGPQAGVIVGSAVQIARLRSHPLTRALRVDGSVYAGLEATLEAYLAGDPERIPFWRQALTRYETLEDRVSRLASVVTGTVVPASSMVGAGSAAGVEIPTPVLRIEGRQDMFEPLLDADPPVLARRDAGDLVVDLRAVDPEDDNRLAAVLAACL
ncbi:MAG TPA: L-seryl-tRNA(Sec) selenium transferase [Acidimicrobiia bacterium]|nr:L-seryl-tRNA(Sec) selenium transferase [Acidimicrobiia bacterium]